METKLETNLNIGILINFALFLVFVFYIGTVRSNTAMVAEQNALLMQQNNKNIEIINKLNEELSSYEDCE